MSLARGIATLLGRAVTPPVFNGAYYNRYFPYSGMLGELETTPLGVPSFRAGVDLKASMVGSLPPYTEVNGRRRDFVPPLLFQPDPSEPRLTTLHKMASSFVYHGEVIAPITSYNEEGYAQSLVVVDPACAQLSPDGLTWDIGNLRGIPRSEVMHLVRFPIPGQIRGVGSVELNRCFFQGLEAQERFQRDFYLNGGIPSIMVGLEPGASQGDIDEAKRSWKEKLTTREPMFVPAGIKAEAFQLSNQDQQYIEGKQITLQEVSNIVGLPGWFIGASQSSRVYANVQDERRTLVDIYLRPDIVLIEWGFSTFLADGMKAKLDTNALLRTDPMATAQLLTAELAYKTLNEVRGDLGLPPLEGGDALPGGVPNGTPELPVGNTSPALSVVPQEAAG